MFNIRAWILYKIHVSILQVYTYKNYWIISRGLTMFQSNSEKHIMCHIIYLKGTYEVERQLNIWGRVIQKYILWYKKCMYNNQWVSCILPAYL